MKQSECKFLRILVLVFMVDTSIYRFLTYLLHILTRWFGYMMMTTRNLKVKVLLILVVVVAVDDSF